MNHKNFRQPQFGSDAAWRQMAQNLTDYNASERHFANLQKWAVIFFIAAFAFLLVAGSAGWIK